MAQTIGRHHQYPDGFMLFLGTLFAPTQDRGTPGGGFTHKLGDVVTISNVKLGALTNTVRLSTECPEWTFGASHLMRNLAGRGLLRQPRALAGPRAVRSTARARAASRGHDPAHPLLLALRREGMIHWCPSRVFQLARHSRCSGVSGKDSSGP